MSGRFEPFKQAQDCLPRLKAVFFARWDEDKGCEITYQVPENSIGVTSTAPHHHHPHHHHRRRRHHEPGQKDVDQLVDETDNSKPFDHDSTLELNSQSHPESNPDHRDPHEYSHSKNLFEFTDVIDFILPKKHLCGHMVTISSGSSKILGFPNLIEDEEKYERNFFMFNLCFVFDKDSELLGYEPIVRKTGRVLRSLEQKSSLLSTPNNSTFQIKSILEELFEELNSFSEVSISSNHLHRTNFRFQTRDRHQAEHHGEEERERDDNSTDPCISSTSALFLLNLKLFPFYGNPPKVEDWNVPLSLVSFSKLRSEITWDLTMYKLVPFIDGIATVAKISRLADVDIYLTRECIQHLVFFGCCIITDLFRFSNSYKLVGGPVLDLLGDSNNFESIKLQEELKDYVFFKPTSPLLSSQTRESGQNQDPQRQDPTSHDREQFFLYNHSHDYQHDPSSISNLLSLYNEFKSGITVHDWMENNQVHELNLDVRRFISFGTIKGFLKRLHCYPIWALHPSLSPSGSKNPNTESNEEDGHYNHQYPLRRQSGSQSQTHRRHSIRPSSSGLRQPAWLVVLKRLHHPHPLLIPSPSLEQDPDGEQRGPSDDQSAHAKKLAQRKLLSRVHQHPSQRRQQAHHHHSSVAVQVPKDLPLKLDGTHHLDQLCVEFKISLIQLEQILRYIDTLSLEELTHTAHPLVSFTASSAMQTVYY